MNDWKSITLTQEVDLAELKLKLIDKVATNLWGKDLRNASDIARAICIPISEYIYEIVKLRMQGK